MWPHKESEKCYAKWESPIQKKKEKKEKSLHTQCQFMSEILEKQREQEANWSLPGAGDHGDRRKWLTTKVHEKILVRQGNVLFL